MAFCRRFVFKRRVRRGDRSVLLVFHVADFGLVGVDLRQAVDEDEVAHQLVFVDLVFFDKAVDELHGQSWFPLGEKLSKEHTLAGMSAAQHTG